MSEFSMSNFLRRIFYVLCFREFSLHNSRPAMFYVLCSEFSEIPEAGIQRTTLFPRLTRDIITCAPHPQQRIRKSAPTRTTSHRSLPHGCFFFRHRQSPTWTFCNLLTKTISTSGSQNRLKAPHTYRLMAPSVTGRLPLPPQECPARGTGPHPGHLYMLTG